eukprot:TRINITY_DN6113_c2_g1_i1.p1 TRINITY_DN6113_c2_g1~~TRINITY_DN6113_c2_g1_i1.p1  ORF type:complete len:796 (+),score=222.04 TRINITY_DN6113_c2_g1_i1:56-2443(+)
MAAGREVVWKEEGFRSAIAADNAERRRRLRRLEVLDRAFASSCGVKHGHATLLAAAEGLERAERALAGIRTRLRLLQSEESAARHSLTGASLVLLTERHEAGRRGIAGLCGLISASVVAAVAARAPLSMLGSVAALDTVAGFLSAEPVLRSLTARVQQTEFAEVLHRRCTSAEYIAYACVEAPEAARRGAEALLELLQRAVWSEQRREGVRRWSVRGAQEMTWAAAVRRSAFELDECQVRSVFKRSEAAQRHAQETRLWRDVSRLRLLQSELGGRNDIAAADKAARYAMASHLSMLPSEHRSRCEVESDRLVGRSALRKLHDAQVSAWRGRDRVAGEETADRHTLDVGCTEGAREDAARGGLVGCEQRGWDGLQLVESHWRRESAERYALALAYDRERVGCHHAHSATAVAHEEDSERLCTFGVAAHTHAALTGRARVQAAEKAERCAVQVWFGVDRLEAAARLAGAGLERAARVHLSALEALQVQQSAGRVAVAAAEEHCRGHGRQRRRSEDEELSLRMVVERQETAARACAREMHVLALALEPRARRELGFDEARAFDRVAAPSTVARDEGEARLALSGYARHLAAQYHVSTRLWQPEARARLKVADVECWCRKRVAVLRSEHIHFVARCAVSAAAPGGEACLRRGIGRAEQAERGAIRKAHLSARRDKERDPCNRPREWDDHQARHQHSLPDIRESQLLMHPWRKKPPPRRPATAAGDAKKDRRRRWDVASGTELTRPLSAGAHCYSLDGGAHCRVPIKDEGDDEEAGAAGAALRAARLVRRDSAPAPRFWP